MATLLEDSGCQGWGAGRDGGSQAGWPPESNTGPKKKLLVLGRDSDAGAGASSLETRRKSNLPEHPIVSKMLPRL